jgi:hypothetical protein
MARPSPLLHLHPLASIGRLGIKRRKTNQVTKIAQIRTHTLARHGNVSLIFWIFNACFALLFSLSRKQTLTQLASLTRKLLEIAVLGCHRMEWRVASAGEGEDGDLP